MLYCLFDVGVLVEVDVFVVSFVVGFEEVKNLVIDSLIYQLLGDWFELFYSKIDVFREWVVYVGETKVAFVRVWVVVGDDGKLVVVWVVEQGFGDFDGVEVGVFVDLLLLYWVVLVWIEMVVFVEWLFFEVVMQMLVREQLGMVFNWVYRGVEVEQVLILFVQQRGVLFEMCGLFGWVYKDEVWEVCKVGWGFEVDGFRDWVIVVYLQGFEVDWRDVYLGINVVQLIYEVDFFDVCLVLWWCGG